MGLRKTKRGLGRFLFGFCMQRHGGRLPVARSAIVVGRK